MHRRNFLKLGLESSLTVLGASWASQSVWGQQSELLSKVEQGIASAHSGIWSKFMDSHGLMLDFANKDGKVLLPTAEECRLGKPNALGWWSPIENGPMFTGMYLEAMVLRWSLTKEPEIAQKAKKMVQGLLKASSVSETPGFVARGFGSDGESHYPMGSDDQIAPWFLGLWCYCNSEIPSKEEVQQIKTQYLKVADALYANAWNVPAEAPFGKRGTFQGFNFDHVTRLLFVCRTAFELSGDIKWKTRYFNYLREVGSLGTKLVDRLEVCQRGMVYHYAAYHSWTSCTSVACLRVLWEMEEVEVIKRAYLQGLKSSMTLAAKNLAKGKAYKNGEVQAFEYNWSVMNDSWKPQTTEQEAVAVASVQINEFEKISPQRLRETSMVREPCSAAWIVSLCPNLADVKKYEADIFSIIMQYNYPELVYSQFFWVENAYWRLKTLEAEAASKEA